MIRGELEHTSLIATILRRFAADPERALAAMPGRVQKAPHLGELLEAEPRSDIGGRGGLHADSEWRVKARAERRAAAKAPSLAPNGAGHDLELHDFQDEFARFAMAMRARGLPPGRAGPLESGLSAADHLIVAEGVRIER